MFFTICFSSLGFLGSKKILQTRPETSNDFDSKGTIIWQKQSHNKWGKNELLFDLSNIGKLNINIFKVIDKLFTVSNL